MKDKKRGRSFHVRLASLCACVVLFAILSGTGCPPTPPVGPVTIVASPTGCGMKVDNQKTLNWSVTFSAVGAAPNSTFQWNFGDGATGTGQTVVHTYKTLTQEAAQILGTVDHDPVKFTVTVNAGADTATQTFDIPMRGTPNGGPDPAGDTCIPNEGRTHSTANLCYISNPPASGAHDPAPVQAGVYDEALPTQKWVHNLEHGTIVLLYDCGGPCSADFIAQLQAFFDALPPSSRFNEKKMVITRYPGVTPPCTGTPTFPGSGPFLAISWDVQRAFTSFDTAGILDFYLRHVDQGPEDSVIPAGVHTP